MKTEFSTIIKKRTLGLTLVFGMASLSFAQDKENISGKISDTQNNPIPYASITFENIDNKLLATQPSPMRMETINWTSSVENIL